MKTALNSWSLALRVFQTLWHAATMYLPIAIIVLLALGTWWLARNTPSAVPRTEEQAPKHEADYFMRNFALKNFAPSGQLSSELQGAEGRHFPDTDVLEIDDVRMRSFAKGQLTTATAKRAYSNGDGSEVQLVGNAVIVREAALGQDGKARPRMEFRGEFLHAFRNTEQLKSHKPVTIIRGSDQFVADSLQFDNIDRVLQLQGRVKGTFNPRTAP
jgi:lipopolysaccharide export system protein LptC